MSLIHQALKKLESGRTGYDPSLKDIPVIRGNGHGKRRILFPVVAAAVTLIFALYFFKPHAKMSSINKDNVKGAVEGNASAEKPEAMDHNKKGLELYKAGRIKEALEEFGKALSTGNADPAFLNNIGITYFELGEIDKAEEALKNALGLRPDYPEALNNYGSLLYKKGDRKKAESFFKKAISLAPVYPDPHLNLAILLETDGRTMEAVSEYERYLSLGGEKFEAVRKKALRLRSSLALNASDSKNADSHIPSLECSLSGKKTS